MARDISWLLLAALGAAAFYFALDYEFGTPSNVGSAIYPLILSSAIVLISLYSFLFSPPEATLPANTRALVCVGLAVLVFIQLVEVVGLLPTIILSMTIAYAGQTTGRYGRFLLYATLFAVAVWFLFSHALNLPIPPIRMP